MTTSKTKQFCETSFNNGKLSAELTASYQCFLRFFRSICLNYCACHEKVRPGHTKCCTCHAKSSQQTSDEHVSCTAPATENASLQILFKCPTPALVFGMLQNLHVLLTFEVHNPLRLLRETASKRSKVARTCGVLSILASKLPSIILVIILVIISCMHLSNAIYLCIIQSKRSIYLSI